MSVIISGKDISNEFRYKMSEEVKEIKERYGRAPHLAVIIVGDDPASQSYVKGKTKACEEVGISNTTIEFSSDITQLDLLNKIGELNRNTNIDGILVQLPLPKHIDEEVIMRYIDPMKDVDGFHPVNVNGLYTGKDCIKPCTPTGILKLLNNANVEIEGKNVVVLGRSNIVGLPVSKMLLDENATVTICHSKTKNLKEITSQADILIVAIGKPKFITSDMVKEGAVVIDVGVNRIDNKLVGDVDFDNVKNKTSAITPVPGGVGPMTITCLLENTINCFKKIYLL